MTKKLPNAQWPQGFTLLETLVVSGLMALLVLLLAEAWSGLGRPLVDAMARSRVAEEANLAVTSLTRDWSGSLPGSLGSLEQGRAVGHLVVDRSQLWICFDGGPAPNEIADWAAPDTVISYAVESNKLIRQNQTTGSTFVAAKDVETMEVTDLGTAVEIKLTLRYRDVSRSYSLIAKTP